MRRLPGIVSVVVLAAGAAWAAPSATAATTDGGAWSLDEASGLKAFDSSGNGNDGTVRGGVVQGLPGRVGTAYSFDAPGSWVEVPNAPSLNPGTRNFTMSASVKVGVVPGTGVTYDIIRKGLAGTKTGEFKLEIIKGGLLKCTAKDSARLLGAITFPRVNVANGQWHDIGCARTGSTWQVILDGTVKSKSVAFGSISNTKSLAIGSKYGNDDGTPGLVDEVRLSIG
jgi:hypothetical protein